MPEVVPQVSPPSDPPPGPPLPPEMFSLPLEILRTLHNASSYRWERRREYEWKLSYAVWTALAGFIATVIFGKDARFEAPGEGKLVVSLVLLCGLHSYYLINMVSRTIGDLKAQTEIEKKINSLMGKPIVEEKYLGAGMDRLWVWQRYGVWSQLGITIVLCVAAGWFSNHRPKPDTTPAPSPITVVCPQPPTLASQQPPQSLPKSRKHRQ